MRAEHPEPTPRPAAGPRRFLAAQARWRSLEGRAGAGAGAGVSTMFQIGARERQRWGALMSRLCLTLV